MTKSPSNVFQARQATIVDLPLPANATFLHPENTMIRVAGCVHDIGSYCYTLRSPKLRRPNAACEVVPDSFLPQRVSQVASLIRVLSSQITDAGLRAVSVENNCGHLRDFMHWADRTGHHDCLSGGVATRDAYRNYAQDVEDRYRRHVFGSAAAFQKQKHVRTLLELLTGQDDLDIGIRLVRYNSKESSGTQPAGQHDFSHALALNEALFRGLCDLVLEFKPFPYQLSLPDSLGWKENHLWLFPASQWFLHPDLHEAKSDRHGLYNYREGRLYSEDEIWPHYRGNSETEKRYVARATLKRAKANLAGSNADPRAYYRLKMTTLAQSGFLFLFLANTGGNLQSVIDIETDGKLDVGVANQGYRSTKWRAGGKEVDLVVPVAFMPSLNRYLQLRAFLLNGADCPYLFFGSGKTYNSAPSKCYPNTFAHVYSMLARIDPLLPRIGPKKIRATVSDYYHREHDAAITAAVLQNTEITALRHYNAGTTTDHQIEMSLLLQKIATKAQTKVIPPAEVQANFRPLEDGGVCPSYGQPEVLTANAPFTPNCKTGCLFCAKRVLIANEEDARKVASAAFLMERLIMGPLSEAEYRPQIIKCDEDLEKLRAFQGCAQMVDHVKADVYENGNLTPYFADKYQLFMTLGVL